MIIPQEWFMPLKASDGSKPLASDLERFGFISDPTGDPLPIGFATHKDSQSGRTWVGFTCAACHTGRIRYGSRSILAEGAPALIDFEAFVAAVVDAMGRYTPPATDAKDYAALREKLIARADYNKTDIQGGYGRVDAFGHIFNDVAVIVLKNGPSAAVKPDAPASFPFLWDIAQHKRVQWNGSAPNLGVGGDGAIMRNIGEVVGVFGEVTLPDKYSGLPNFRSSAVIPNLRVLESWISELHSPQWPSNIFPPLQPNLVSRGGDLYKSNCESCHAVINSRSVPNPVPTTLVDVKEVGTDPNLVNNYNKFATNSRQLQGHLTLLNPRKIWTTFKPNDSVAMITAYITAGILNGEDPKGTHRVGDAFQLFAEGMPDAYAYKARPLNGIWATAPFLHNGSLPNLDELLKAPEQRARAFCVGTADFDPKLVGYPALTDSSQSCGSQSKVDTSLPGNRNIGHNYGTNLSADDKRALIEYVKSL
jgi:hypothetical protein